MRSIFYKLDCDLFPVPLQKGEESFPMDVQVAYQIHIGFRISTVFLMIDKGYYLKKHTPILFETRIFDEYDEAGLLWGRYAYWHQAWIGHLYAVEYVLSKRLLGVEKSALSAC